MAGTTACDIHRVTRVQRYLRDQFNANDTVIPVDTALDRSGLCGSETQQQPYRLLLRRPAHLADVCRAPALQRPTLRRGSSIIPS